MGVFDGLREACGQSDGALEIGSMGEALVAMSAAGTEELAVWSRAMFGVIDADGDGSIGPSEYRDLLSSVDIDAPVADEAFARLDGDGDGRLSEAEFTALYLDFYRSNDPEAPGSWLWGPF
jgi:Ca2+-binding EF-hand superfamily protein